MLPPTLSWLDAKFMERVLRISEDDESIEVRELSMDFAKGLGRHYTSDMIRASVEYSRKSEGRGVTEKSLIIKVTPTLEDGRKEMVSSTGVFELEIKMMRRTLEQMNELLDEQGYRLNARALYTDSGDPSLLVLEDLSAMGYGVVERYAGLDLDHCILVMRGLAKFHASSVALCEKDPQVKEYKHGIFYTKIHSQIDNFFSHGLRIFANEIRSWRELGSDACRFSEKILKLSNSIFVKGVECYKPKDDAFNVLNHGDCWGTNMLFRYDDAGKVISHIFVDFQMCCWTTPLMDILMFMNSCTSENVELYHHEALLEEYWECLRKTMSRLGCKTEVPSVSFLTKIKPGYEIMSVIASCVGLPLIFTNSNKSKSVDEIYNGTEYDASPYKKPEYRRRMIRRLHAWNACGVFDIC